ncbi:ISL3 family transposase [Pseudomonas paraeruginosa]|nr:ISL3 family transposase [Pseudomonas aeruginosa]
MDGFRMTLRLHEYVEGRNPSTTPTTFVAAQTGLDEKTVRDIFNPAPSSWGAGTASRRPASWALTSYT